MTPPANQDYSVPAPAKSGVGFGSLCEAANGRKYQAMRLFLRLGVPIYGRTEQGAARLAGASPVFQPVQFPPTMFGSVVSGSLNELEAHIMTTTNSGAFAPVVFQFQSTNIRTFADDNGEPWFCANDVCEVLGYANPRDAISKHCRQGGVAKRDTPSISGDQEMTFINEGNLYRLIVKSRKPEAEKFEQLVMDEILPAIRKTGSYQHRQESLPTIDVNQIERLIQKQLRLALPANQANDCLLPPKQAKEINERLNRLAGMFHPFSDQFADVLGVIRVLRGLHPALGHEESGYIAVINDQSKQRG